jgi:hypothetical protein
MSRNQQRDVILVTAIQFHDLNAVFGWQNAVTLRLKQTLYQFQLLDFILREQNQVAHGLPFLRMASYALNVGSPPLLREAGTRGRSIQEWGPLSYRSPITSVL